jgi:uroporphyrinogen-III synthase
MSLRGKRIVVTRPRAQAEAFCAQLSALGATPIRFPTIEIVPLRGTPALDAALATLGDFDWIVLTSVNAVEALFGRLSAKGSSLAELEAWQRAGGRLAAVGPVTARALTERGLRVALIASQHRAEALADQLGDVNGQQILLPQSEIAPPALAEALRGRGAHVRAVPAYGTVAAMPECASWAELRRGVDVITFASASAVTHFVRLVSLETVAPAVIACLGPATARTAQQLGWPVHVVANQHTTGGLITALTNFYTPLEEQHAFA